jgi:hypothetical protein
MNDKKNEDWKKDDGKKKEKKMFFDFTMSEVKRLIYFAYPSNLFLLLLIC